MTETICPLFFIQPTRLSCISIGLVQKHNEYCHSTECSCLWKICPACAKEGRVFVDSPEDDFFSVGKTESGYSCFCLFHTEHEEGVKKTDINPRKRKEPIVNTNFVYYHGKRYRKKLPELLSHDALCWSLRQKVTSKSNEPRIFANAFEENAFEKRLVDVLNISSKEATDLRRRITERKIDDSIPEGAMQILSTCLGKDIQSLKEQIAKNMKTSVSAESSSIIIEPEEDAPLASIAEESVCTAETVAVVETIGTQPEEIALAIDQSASYEQEQAVHEEIEAVGSGISDKAQASLQDDSQRQAKDNVPRELKQRTSRRTRNADGKTKKCNQLPEEPEAKQTSLQWPYAHLEDSSHDTATDSIIVPDWLCKEMFDIDEMPLFKEAIEGGYKVNVNVYDGVAELLDNIGYLYALKEMGIVHPPLKISSYRFFDVRMMLYFKLNKARMSDWEIFLLFENFLKFTKTSTLSTWAGCRESVLSMFIDDGRAVRSGSGFELLDVKALKNLALKGSRYISRK